MVVEFSLTRFSVLLAVFENSQSSPGISVGEGPVMVTKSDYIPKSDYFNKVTQVRNPRIALKCISMQFGQMQGRQ